MGFGLGAKPSSHPPPPSGCCPPGGPPSPRRPSPPGRQRPPHAVPSPFRRGYLPSASAPGAPSLPFLPPRLPAPPEHPYPLPGTSLGRAGGSQQPHERGRSRDRGSLAQGSGRPWQPRGSREVFLLPILPGHFLMLFPVFIPVPLPTGTAPIYFPGWGPPWDGDPLGTGTPSGPHPGRTQ